MAKLGLKNNRVSLWTVAGIITAAALIAVVAGYAVHKLRMRHVMQNEIRDIMCVCCTTPRSVNMPLASQRRNLRQIEYYACTSAGRLSPKLHWGLHLPKAAATAKPIMADRPASRSKADDCACNHQIIVELGQLGGDWKAEGERL